MSKKKTGVTARENRAEARRAGFTGTEEARKAGKYLPTKEQRVKNKAQNEKVAVETRPKIDTQKKADEIIKRGDKK